MYNIHIKFTLKVDIYLWSKNVTRYHWKSINANKESFHQGDLNFFHGENAGINV